MSTTPPIRTENPLPFAQTLKENIHKIAFVAITSIGVLLLTVGVLGAVGIVSADLPVAAWAAIATTGALLSLTGIVLLVRDCLKARQTSQQVEERTGTTTPIQLTNTQTQGERSSTSAPQESSSSEQQPIQIQPQHQLTPKRRQVPQQTKETTHTPLSRPHTQNQSTVTSIPSRQESSASTPQSLQIQPQRRSAAPVSPTSLSKEEVSQLAQKSGLPVLFLDALQELRSVTAQEIRLICNHRILKNRVVENLRNRWDHVINSNAQYTMHEFFDQVPERDQLKKQALQIRDVLARLTIEELKSLDWILAHYESSRAGHLESKKLPYKSDFPFLRNLIKIQLFSKNLDSSQKFSLSTLEKTPLIFTCSQGQNRSAVGYAAWLLLTQETALVDHTHGGDNGLNPSTSNATDVGKAHENFQAPFNLSWMFFQYWLKVYDELVVPVSKGVEKRIGIDIEYINQFGFMKPHLFMKKEFIEFAKKKNWTAETLEQFLKKAEALNSRSNTFSTCQEMMNDPVYQELASVQRELITWFKESLETYKVRSRPVFATVASSKLTIESEGEKAPKSLNSFHVRSFARVEDNLGKSLETRNATDNHRLMIQNLLEGFASYLTS